MLNNPSTLYSQNQGIFDSKPYLRMGQQLDQQKQARDAALNKYNQTLGDKINGAGLNYDDIEGLDTRVKNFQDYFKGNSKQINKGNTPEKQQYDLLIRDAQSYVEKGKAKMKDAVQLFAFQNQKGNEDVNLEPEFAEIVHKATLPLDKGYEPANMIKVMRPPKTYDDNAHTISMGRFKPATFKEIITIDPNDDTKDIVTKVPDFTKEQDDQIKAHATGEYGTNRSYHRKVDELVKDPGIKQLFSTVYKNQYGIEATHPEDFAIAYDLSKIQEAPQTRVRVTNAERVRGQKNEDFKSHADYTQAYKRANIALNNATNGSGIKVNDVYAGIGVGIDNGDLVEKDDATGEYKTVGVSFNKLNDKQQMVTSTSIKSVYPKINMNNVFFGRNNNGLPTAWAKSEDGKLVKSDKRLLMSFTETGVNLKAYQPGVKEKRAIVEKGDITPKSAPTKKTTPFVEPKGKAR